MFGRCLAVAGVAEGTSLGRVLFQLRSQARRANAEVLDRVRGSPDTTVKAALFDPTQEAVRTGRGR